MTTLPTPAASSFVSPAPVDAADRAPDVLAALRTATAARHDAVEGAMPLAASSTLDAYRRHLLLIRAWLAPFEHAFAAFDDGPQDAARVSRITREPLIERDLAHPAMRALDAGIHADVHADNANAVAAAATLPPLQTDAAWRWGASYVIEGSQLGGAVLLRRLREPLAPHPLHYLGGEGAGPGPRWHAFIAALREAVRSPQEVARACAGACDAFDRLIAVLAAQPREHDAQDEHTGHAGHTA
ncbi:biliverdin-producing heme oxygenase [Paraburkholderia acidisoli]|uniref:biliverdin-producing heme oxygenase n=1 Tax=Paraburkholderia acidisoli TaxID=2571748 RepID=UPI001E41F094|nr:biliverdin-producing heme oxygenase [Paraburkholderia acidisoli]